MFYRHVFLLFFVSFSIYASSIKETEIEVKKWLAIEIEKSQALRAWEQERVILESEIILLQNQSIQTSENIKAKLKLKTDAVEKSKKLKLAGKKQDKVILDLNDLYSQKVGVFKTELMRFPSSLSKPLIDKLVEQAKGSLAVRFSSLLVLISEAKQVTNRWHLVDQTLNFGGRPVLCQVLYAGVSKGFAITRDKNQAFVGTFRQNGWSWSSSPEKKAIGNAIKNFQSGGISRCQLPFIGGERE